MGIRYEDVIEGSIVYKKEHKVRVNAKVNDVDRFDNVRPGVEIEYLNQPSHWSPEFTGSGNLSEEPLHCYHCQTNLIDDIELRKCPKCRKIHCPSCNNCHCHTQWDPNNK
ncbi:hypothetical protein PDN58_22450 [Bacillus cereus]|nr:hypothetical protein [Bacillus cereus]MDA2056691.1 hypothetical protein [Bacillus cereus]